MTTSASKGWAGKTLWQSSEGEQLGWAGGCICSLSLSCARGQTACVHHFHHLLHLSCDALESLASVVMGRGTCHFQGFEGWGGGHPRSCQFCFCVSACMLQQKIRGACRLNEACKTSLLCSQERQSKELNLKIKLQ